jgi:hypothetical protein
VREIRRVAIDAGGDRCGDAGMSQPSAINCSNSATADAALGRKTETKTLTATRRS